MRLVAFRKHLKNIITERTEIMWAYNETFYQIYPIGFCGAPTHNDDVTMHRILKIADWAGYLEELGIGSIILNPILNQIITAMTQEILRRSTVASERTKISKQYVKRFIRTISRSCSTGYSITSAEVFGHFRMC